MTWPERFVATNVRYDFQGRGFARTTMLADPRYGAIIAKIDTTDLWRCTYAEDAALPEDRVRERIPAYFAAVLGEQPELDRYQPYSMHQRAAEEFRVGRVLLCGDAAHVTNPTGGLGPRITGFTPVTQSITSALTTSASIAWTTTAAATLNWIVDDGQSSGSVTQNVENVLALNREIS